MAVVNPHLLRFHAVLLDDFMALANMKFRQKETYGAAKGIWVVHIQEHNDSSLIAGVIFVKKEEIQEVFHSEIRPHLNARIDISNPEEDFVLACVLGANGDAFICNHKWTGEEITLPNLTGQVNIKKTTCNHEWEYNSSGYPYCKKCGSDFIHP
jgi:hypothetical protein